MSLSNTTIQRRILHLDEDIEDQVVAAIKMKAQYYLQERNSFSALQMERQL